MFFFIFISFCAKKQMIINDIPNFNIKEMIDNLESGFSFEWEMKNKIMTFKSKGNYIGGGKYQMEGEIVIDGKKEKLQDFNPYEMIRVVSGENDFKFKEYKNGFYIFNFTANLFFLNPNAGIGKGEIFIKDSTIRNIICSGDNAFFRIIISKDRSPTAKFYIDYEGEIDNLIKRLITFGERDISIEGNILKFKEVRDIDERIFNKGKVEFFLLKNDYNGKIKDPIDTLFAYSILSPINIVYKQVDKLYDQKGRPSITISIEDNVEGYIGFFVDNVFVSCGIGKKYIFFPFKDEIERDLYYSIIVSGELNGKVKNYRRLK